METSFHSTSFQCGNSCKAILGVLNALKFYQSLNIQTAHGQSDLMKFWKQKYPHLLSDFVHLITDHDKDKEFDRLYEFATTDISINLGACNIFSCEYSDRYNSGDRSNTHTIKYDYNATYNNNDTIEHNNESSSYSDNDDSDNESWLTFENEVNNTSEKHVYRDDGSIKIHDITDDDSAVDLDFSFVSDLLDEIHCYILHAYDCGFRIQHKQQKIINQRSKDENLDHLTDQTFAFISETIQNKKKPVSQLQRFLQHDKFTVKTVADELKTDEHTMKDTLREMIAVKHKNYKQTIHFLEEEEYDSDAIEADVHMRQEVITSNISHVAGEQTHTIIKLFLGQIQYNNDRKITQRRPVRIHAFLRSDFYEILKQTQRSVHFSTIANYIDDEEYDSDAIQQDIIDYDPTKPAANKANLLLLRYEPLMQNIEKIIAFIAKEVKRIEEEQIMIEDRDSSETKRMFERMRDDQREIVRHFNPIKGMFQRMKEYSQLVKQSNVLNIYQNMWRETDERRAIQCDMFIQKLEIPPSNKWKYSLFMELEQIGAELQERVTVYDKINMLCNTKFKKYTLMDDLNQCLVNTKDAIILKYIQEEEYDTDCLQYDVEVETNILSEFRYRGHQMIKLFLQNQHTFNLFVENKLTLMDELYKYVGVEESTQVWQYFKAEEYDSDAMEQDAYLIEDLPSNLSKHSGQETYDTVKKYINGLKTELKSFSTGYGFYYWTYYKKQNEDKITEDPRNLNDHAGHEPYELYVTPKYKHIKQEIFENSKWQLTYNQFLKSLKKANQYINTDYARTISANEYQDRYLHYSIKPGTPLRVSNLLAIILYTDWSILCTEFSKTFRKIQFYEPMSAVKARNSEIAHWARIFRETVEGFGDSVWTFDDYFYCGVSSVMPMPEFNIRLRAPTSSSKHLEVASHFAGVEGMVITLCCTDMYVGDRMTFDCSWLSRYKDEAEWVFCGGHHRMQIHTVRIPVQIALEIEWH
eukprot:227263_1